MSQWPRPINPAGPWGPSLGTGRGLEVAWIQVSRSCSRSCRAVVADQGPTDGGGREDRTLPPALILGDPGFMYVNVILITIDETLR